MTFSVPTLDTQGRFESPAVRAELEAMAQAKAEEVVAATPATPAPEVQQLLINAAYRGGGTYQRTSPNFEIAQINRTGDMLRVQCVTTAKPSASKKVEATFDLSNALPFLPTDQPADFTMFAAVEYREVGGATKSISGQGTGLGVMVSGNLVKLTGWLPADFPASTNLEAFQAVATGFTASAHDVPAGYPTAVNLETGLAL